MANWYGTARSNYFRVNDEAKFKAWAETLDLHVWQNSIDGRFAFSPSELADDGGWPSQTLENEEVNLPALLAPYLAEHEVAVLMEIGAEKLRYVTGDAVAVAWTGEVIQVNLEDIYKLAQDEFGGDAVITQAYY